MNIRLGMKILLGAVLLCWIGLFAHAEDDVDSHLKELQMLRKLKFKEVMHCQEKIAWAKKKLVGAEAHRSDETIAKWQREYDAWSRNVKVAAAEVEGLDRDIAGLQKVKTCEKCDSTDHEFDARFCITCGQELKEAK